MVFAGDLVVVRKFFFRHAQNPARGPDINLPLPETRPPALIFKGNLLPADQLLEVGAFVYGGGDTKNVAPEDMEKLARLLEDFNNG